MIGKLRGLVDESDAETVIVDVGGVGYVVFCPARTLMNLPPRGGMVELTIETHVREDHIHLYGFASAQERDWFRLLTSVQGVGAKMGLAILGTLDPDALIRTIGAQDKTGLTRVSGVGPKLAERIVTELKSKVAKMPGSFSMPTGSAPVAVPVKGKKSKAAAPAGGNLMDDAVSALVNLGYNRTEAFTVVAQALQQAEGDAPSLDNVIRDSLRELVR